MQQQQPPQVREALVLLRDHPELEELNEKCIENKRQMQREVNKITQEFKCTHFRLWDEIKDYLVAEDAIPEECPRDTLLFEHGAAFAIVEEKKVPAKKRPTLKKMENKTEEQAKPV